MRYEEYRKLSEAERTGVSLEEYQRMSREYGRQHAPQQVGYFYTAAARRPNGEILTYQRHVVEIERQPGQEEFHTDDPHRTLHPATAQWFVVDVSETGVRGAYIYEKFDSADEVQQYATRVLAEQAVADVYFFDELEMRQYEPGFHGWVPQKR